MEWIGVIDTAVKIGLGGLISGIFTYKITTLKTITDKNNYEKEYMIRNIENSINLLSEINIKLTSLRKSYTDFNFEAYTKDSNKKNIYEVDPNGLQNIKENLRESNDYSMTNMPKVFTTIMICGGEEPILDTFNDYIKSSKETLDDLTTQMKNEHKALSEVIFEKNDYETKLLGLIVVYLIHYLKKYIKS